MDQGREKERAGYMQTGDGMQIKGYLDDLSNSDSIVDWLELQTTTSRKKIKFQLLTDE